MSAGRNAGLVRCLRMAELLRVQRQTVHQLAERFEVTTRTVRRDLDVLECAGVPIKSERRDYGLSTRFWVEEPR